jgi:hypothetical protein
MGDIEKGCEEFLDACDPKKEFPAMQRAEMKRAFMSGAYFACVEALTGILPATTMARECEAVINRIIAQDLRDQN